MADPAWPTPTCCGYIAVVHPVLGDARAARGRHALPVLPARRQPGHRLPRGGRRSGHPPEAIVRRLRTPVHHRRRGGSGGRQAQRRHRAVQSRQGRQRGPASLPGSPGRRRRARAARPPGGGGRPRRWRGRDPQPRGGAGHPRPAPRAGRSGLHALRERLPLVLLHRRLREGDRRASSDGPAARRRSAISFSKSSIEENER